MLQVDGDLGFIDEAGDEMAVGRQLGQHFLDDTQLLETGETVLGQEYLAHTAATEPSQEQIAAKDPR